MKNAVNKRELHFLRVGGPENSVSSELIGRKSKEDQRNTRLLKFKFRLILQKLCLFNAFLDVLNAVSIVESKGKRNNYSCNNFQRFDAYDAS